MNESIPHVQLAVDESLEVCRHRRAVQKDALSRWRRKLAWLAAPAVVGTALLVYETLQWTPVPALVLLGVVLVVPFLVTIGDRP